MFLVVFALLNGLDDGDDLSMRQKGLSEFPESLGGSFRRTFAYVNTVYKRQSARILLVAYYYEGGLPVAMLGFVENEASCPTYALELPAQEQKQQIFGAEPARRTRYLNAR